MSSLPALIRLFGKGGLDPISGPLIQADLASVAVGLDLAESQMGDLATELHAQSCTALLERWEALLQIVAEGDAAARVARVVARLSALPDLRPETILGKVEDWTGIDWTLEEYTPFYCDDAGSVCESSAAVVEGALIFSVTCEVADADAASLHRSKVEDYLETIEPAHVESIVRTTGFITDSTYSLCDSDILGS